MEIRADEIASVLRQEMAAFRRELDVATVGHVVEIGDGIARVYGLQRAMAGEMVRFANGVLGQVLNLEEHSTGIVVYGDYAEIKAGDVVTGTGSLLEAPVGGALLGRVIDPLGRPLDGGDPVETSQTRPVEAPAPGIADRQPVTVPLYTGIKAIDSMIPIGRGQRELIIGDRKTGKTSIAVDTIINQVGRGVLCVYVAIGQKESTVAGVIRTLREHHAMEHTVVVACSSADPAPLQYLAPYTGCAIAEHFMYSAGRDTLVVYDDLSKHATAYRQVSLLLRRPPGREAYPGDVFYLHSRLLERSCRLADRYVIAPADTPPDAEPEGVDGQAYERPDGLARAREALAGMENAGALKVHKLPRSGGSLTALPIVETLEGEISAYIPTNAISITDGQIYLEPGLFFAGIRPAINVGVSVSRVGASAQIKAMKRVASSLRLDLAAFRELQAFAQLGTTLDAATQRQLDRGARMVELLKQPLHHAYTVLDQVIGLYAGTEGHLDDLYLADVREFEKGLLAFVHEGYADLCRRINATGEISDADAALLAEAIVAFKKTFRGRKR
ncbi:MAG TPA: F0F1 ATP synthase subunit alpha [Phycisphaerae bacterium]|nr:F0F1 ATP synthase subunit alpha [Phycisphaerae bacterium]